MLGLEHARSEAVERSSACPRSQASGIPCSRPVWSSTAWLSMWASIQTRPSAPSSVRATPLHAPPAQRGRRRARRGVLRGAIRHCGASWPQLAYCERLAPLAAAGAISGPMTVPTPHASRRRAASGASTAGASAQPGSAPPRPHAAPINCTCRCIFTSRIRRRLRSPPEQAQRRDGPTSRMATKWQAWTSFTLSLWLAVSPWLAGYAEHESATANAVIVGLVLALASHFECVGMTTLRRSG